jgi:GntR family transcriptional regulator
LHEARAELIANTEPGNRLPSEPVLAKEMGVSRATLREAMRIFETQGVVHRRQGVGTFVVHPTQVMASGLESLESIEKMAARSNLSVTMGDFAVEVRLPTDEEKRILGLKQGVFIRRISRVIEAENRPVAFLIDIVPDELISQKELNQDFKGTVLELLQKRGSPLLANARTEITVASADTEIARALGVQRKVGVLAFTAYLYTIKGSIVNISYSYFLPGYFKFFVNRRMNQI